MTGALLGDIPFKNVYLHGLVRDGQGRKMSKSLGNIIDPLVMIEKYGADATRLSLVIGAQIGNDIKLSEDRVRGYKHFANKLWNIARFVLENAPDQSSVELNAEDKDLIVAAQQNLRRLTEQIDGFRLDLAADGIYHYVWDEFAAQVIEQSKPILRGEDKAAAGSRGAALNEILRLILKALHPFMPFVTESIWQELPQKDADALMVAAWPV